MNREGCYFVFLIGVGNFYLMFGLWNKSMGGFGVAPMGREGGATDIGL